MDYKDLQERLDSSKMISRFEEMPDRFLEAFHMGYTATLPEGFKLAKQYIGVGMGGSGMGYRLVSAMARNYGAANIEVLADYHLPPYINHNSVVMLTSFSGNTEETLEVAKQAVERGCKIVCITTGGKLAEFAHENNLTLIKFSYPTAPRVGLPYTFGIVSGLLCQAGVLKPGGPSIPELVEVSVQNVKKHWSHNKLQSKGKEIAEAIKDKMVYVLGSDTMIPVAYVWKAMINENAKTIAFTEEIPEMCHNMYLGYQLPKVVLDNTALIFLTSDFDHPQNSKRMKIVGDELKKAGATVIYNNCDSAVTPLSVVLAQILVGDYTSYYLALLDNLDPVEQARINELKTMLR